MSRTRAAALLSLLVASLVATACSDASTAPRTAPNFKCETQGSGNIVCH